MGMELTMHRILVIQLLVMHSHWYGVVGGLGSWRGDTAVVQNPTISRRTVSGSDTPVIWHGSARTWGSGRGDGQGTRRL